MALNTMFAVYGVFCEADGMIILCLNMLLDGASWMDIISLIFTFGHIGSEWIMYYFNLIIDYVIIKYFFGI